MLKNIIKKNLLFLSLVFVYLAISLSKINWLGVQYDEVLFANVAWGMIDGSFITMMFWKIPVMLMQYIGALKAYLYFFIFHIFGASVFSVRFPMILLTCFSLFFIYSSIIYFFDKKTAFLTLFFLILNPTFICLTMFDVGPNAIEMFFKSLFFWFLSIYFQSKKKLWLILAFVGMLLGTYNKLNFIWIINVIVFLFFIGNKKIIRKIFDYWFLLLLPFAFFIFSFVKNNYWSEISLSSFYPRLLAIVNSVSSLIRGDLFFNYLGMRTNYWFGTLILFIWCLIVGWSFFKKLFQKEKDKKYFFVLFFVLLMVLQIIITKSAGAPWHIFMIEPFLTLLFVISCKILLKTNFKILFLIVIFIIYGLWNNYQWFFGYKQKYSNVIWSPAINSLASYTRSQDYHFISLNWGFHNQLIMFDPTKSKYKEIWAQILGLWGNSISDEDKENLFKDKSNRYMTFSSRDTLNAKSEWLKEVEKFKMSVVVEKEFVNDDDETVITVYKLE